LAKDKIKINVFIVDSYLESSLRLSFSIFKRIEFLFINTISFKEKNSNMLIVLSQNSKVSQILENLKSFRSINSHKIGFFIPKKMQNDLKDLNHNFFTYPSKINKIEEKFYNFYSKNFYTFKSLSLIKENVLLCNKTKKTINLTEIESRIIKLLFEDHYVSKEKLNISALSQKHVLESKSLETHLSRLRSKINKLDKTILIVSRKEKGVTIT